MSTSTRRRLGAIVFAGSVVTAVGLQIAGRPFIGYASKVRPMLVWRDVDIHWAVLPFVAVAIIGLLCWILPERRISSTPV
jgi:hypothetical protein